MLLAVWIPVCASAATLRGVDIYHGSWHVDYNLLKKSGNADFMYIKATEGEHSADNLFTENIKGAKSVNIPFGAYHFFHPYSVQSAVLQANFFWNTIKSSGYSLLPVVDVEITDSQDAPVIQATLRAFIQEFNRLSGIKPMIYTYTSFSTRFIGNGFTDFKLWIAHYGVSSPASVPGWGTGYTAWQYSDTGNVAGIYNLADLNVANEGVFLTKPSQPSTPAKTKFPGAGYFGSGKSNNYILMLDKALIAKGYAKYYKYGANGASTKWGSGTRAACAAFQRAQGWKGSGADGIPGPQTWALLGL